MTGKRKPATEKDTKPEHANKAKTKKQEPEPQKKKQNITNGNGKSNVGSET